MHKIIVFMIIALAFPTLGAELPSTYGSLENRSIKPELSAESNEAHSAYNKELKLEPVHPVFRGDVPGNERRARIAPVKPKGPVVKHENMMADQPAVTAEINKIDNLPVLNNDYNSDLSGVFYPDIPYAPGYGYDSGYALSNNYDMTYSMEPDTSTFGLLWSQVPDSRTMVSYVGSTIAWIFGSIFFILLGSVLTVGVCTYTNFCAIHFPILPIHEEMRSLITPERLERISNAADFVKTAINKYQMIQTVTSGTGARKRRAISN